LRGTYFSAGKILPLPLLFHISTQLNIMRHGEGGSVKVLPCAGILIIVTY